MLRTGEKFNIKPVDFYSYIKAALFNESTTSFGEVVLFLWRPVSFSWSVDSGGTPVFQLLMLCSTTPNLVEYNSNYFAMFTDSVGQELGHGKDDFSMIYPIWTSAGTTPRLGASQWLGDRII